jgi:hypothetical protein
VVGALFALCLFCAGLLGLFVLSDFHPSNWSTEALTLVLSALLLAGVSTVVRTAGMFVVLLLVLMTGAVAVGLSSLEVPRHGEPLVKIRVLSASASGTRLEYTEYLNGSSSGICSLPDRAVLLRLMHYTPSDWFFLTREPGLYGYAGFENPHAAEPEGDGGHGSCQTVHAAGSALQNRIIGGMVDAGILQEREEYVALELPAVLTTYVLRDKGGELEWSRLEP